ncbi:alpha-glucosidase/alpha-galactosidase [soil metagenome]
MTPPKITFIGAGSTVFARALLSDLFAFPELHGCSIALMDIDEERLADSEAVAGIEAANAGSSATIMATTDRRAALDSASYVINMIQVGGYRPSTVIDFEVPKQYGLRQTIGDTLGIGGIMRGLRTLPVLVDIARDMEELCPDALLLNYSNPMAILMWGLQRQSRIRSAGLCHSVQGTAAEIAGFLGIPAAEIDYTCAGINHLAFYLTLTHNSSDLYPALKQLLASGHYPAFERVRFSLLRDFGYFVTESSEHFSEYVPWYIKAGRDNLIEQFNVPLDEYPARCEDQLADWLETRRALIPAGADSGDEIDLKRKPGMPGSWTRKLAAQQRSNPAMAESIRQEMIERQRNKKAGHSGEYGSLIIHSMETNQPRVVYGNVANNGLIENLPPDCCVEVPCLVDRNGIRPIHVGQIPPQLASLMQTNINVQRMTVEASLTGKRDPIYQAAMLDPHTAAELSPDEIRSLVDDLIAAHGDWLPEFH